MKNLLIILIILSASATTAFGQTCYENLLQGNNDSSHFSFYAEDITQDFVKLNQNNSALIANHLFQTLECLPIESKIFNLKCTDELGYPICRVDSKYGYFLISEDYMQNIHIIFNRWD